LATQIVEHAENDIGWGFRRNRSPAGGRPIKNHTHEQSIYAPQQSMRLWMKTKKQNGYQEVAMIRHTRHAGICRKHM
jgi:hypothetical protein